MRHVQSVLHLAVEVNCFDDVAACDVERYNAFFHAMLDAGVYFAPSAFETAFMSDAHGDTEIQATLEAADRVFGALA